MSPTRRREGYDDPRFLASDGLFALIGTLAVAAAYAFCLFGLQN